MNRLDLVFPQGNEPKLVEMAHRLGIRTLLLCYHLDDPALLSRRGEVEKLSGNGLTAIFAIYVKNQADVQKAMKHTKEIVARGQPGIYEDSRVAYVIDYESGRREDFIHHRNAGLTQVFVKQGMNAGKLFLVNLSQAMDANTQHVIIGRMLQNNVLYRKYKPRVLAVSGAREALGMRDPKDLQEFLRL